MDDEDNTSDYKLEPVDTERGAFMSYVYFFKALKVAWGESKWNTFMEFLQSLRTPNGERKGKDNTSDYKQVKTDTDAGYNRGDGRDEYVLGAVITGLITFIGSWVYCIATHGFLLGVGLGWLPSMTAAVFVGVFWPFVIIALLLVAFEIMPVPEYLSGGVEAICDYYIETGGLHNPPVCFS